MKRQKKSIIRMNTRSGYIMLLLAAGMLGGCGEEKKEASEQEGVQTVLPSSSNEVTVTTLKKKVFEHQLVSNGKITATEYADLTFGTQDVIAHIYVKNGDRVTKGQKLAELDRFKLENAMEQARNNMAQAELELKDVLIGQGYSPSQMDKVPAEVMRLAKLKSGYEQSKASYEMAEYELEHATLTAPFGGVVANLFTKVHNMVSGSEPFCRIINNATMEVDFNVLENELPLLKEGDRVTVTPYTSTGKVFHGKVFSINPLVDEQAMVHVKARIEGTPKELFDGMNVKVSVFRSVENAMVIPKTAVVLRSGKQVVFSLKNGEAYWNYVHTMLENLEYCTLAEDGDNTLQEGDTIIVTGNLNLAHETPVKVTGKTE